MNIKKLECNKFKIKHDLFHISEIGKWLTFEKKFFNKYNTMNNKNKRICIKVIKFNILLH